MFKLDDSARIPYVYSTCNSWNKIAPTISEYILEIYIFANMSKIHLSVFFMVEGKIMAIVSATFRQLCQWKLAETRAQLRKKHYKLGEGGP
jgi:hypothetical protein